MHGVLFFCQSVNQKKYVQGGEKRMLYESSVGVGIEVVSKRCHQAN